MGGGVESGKKLSCQFSLKYKHKGLFYTDCGCDFNPLVTTYNNCDDDFPNQNNFNIILFIPDTNSVCDLCVCSSILILKKIVDLLHKMKKKNLVLFSKKNDFFDKKDTQIFCFV